MFVQRTVEYRGFEIQIDLLSTSTDMFDVWFRIEASIKPHGAAARGERVKIRGGRFSRRWAYLVAESPAKQLSTQSSGSLTRHELRDASYLVTMAYTLIETASLTAPSMLTVHPTHVMCIKPLNHLVTLVIAHVTLRQHERDDQ
ncbi:hypothetical protein [Paraburkholderia strydomiana]